MPGAAEGRDFGLAQGQGSDLFKVGLVLGVRARPAAFDERYAQPVEGLGQGQFVRQGQVDAFALTTVAQGRIVDFEGVHGHLGSWGGGINDNSHPLGGWLLGSGTGARAVGT